MANGSTITLKNYYNTVSIKDSTLFGDVASRRLICSNFSAYSSIVNEEVSAPNILYKDSQINKDIYSTNNGTSIVTYIDNCIWNDIQQHISSDTANTIISGAWTNNNATKANPIVFDMTNLVNSDGLHHYSYDGNTGTFLPKTFKNSWLQYGVYSINQTTWNYYHLNRPELFNMPCLVRARDRHAVGAGDTSWGYFSFGIWIPSTYTWGNNNIKMFSIGSKNYRFEVNVQVEFTNANINDMTFTYESYNSTFEYKGMTTKDGMNWTNLDLSGKLIEGPNDIPFSSDKFCYNGTADVPEASSPIIPPAGADQAAFYMTLEIV